MQLNISLCTFTCTPNLYAFIVNNDVSANFETSRQQYASYLESLHENSFSGDFHTLIFDDSNFF